MESGRRRPWQSARPPTVGVVGPALLGPHVASPNTHRWLADELGRYVTWARVGTGSGNATDPETPPIVGAVLEPHLALACHETTRPTLGPAPEMAIPVADVHVLGDAGGREHFTERVFALGRLRELREHRLDLGRLVDFHTRHKMQLSAHDQGRYRQLGRLVAQAHGRPPEHVIAEYANLFQAALTIPATRGMRCNAFYHGLGHLKDRVNHQQRNELRTLVERYADATVPLSAPRQRLEHCAASAGIDYLTQQTFLAPYPDDLGLAEAM